MKVDPNRFVTLVRGSRDLGARGGVVAIVVSLAGAIDATAERLGRKIAARSYHQKAGWS